MKGWKVQMHFVFSVVVWCVGDYLMENILKGYLVVHLYFVLFLGFTADQKDFVAENEVAM